MKKKILSMLLAVCMIVGLLPATVLADGTEQKTARSYSELVNYLNSDDPELKEIIIAGRYWDGHEYKEFNWEDETSLELKTTGQSKDILISGPWVIPSGVTVNVYKQVTLSYNDGQRGPSITVNGTWNVAAAYFNGSVYGYQDYQALTINEGGTLTANENIGFSGDFTPVSGNAKLVLNGTLDLKGNACNVASTWVLGPAAVVTSSANKTNREDLLLQNGSSISGTEGASIGVNMYAVQNAGSATLSGDLHIPRLNFTNGGTLTIAEGAHVSTDQLYCHNISDTTILNVNGMLELGKPETQVFSQQFNNMRSGVGQDNTMTMNIGSNGVVKLNPYNYLEHQDEGNGSRITGTGTIKLYAQYDETVDGNYKNFPAVYGQSHQHPHQVADTITIWRNWENVELHELIAPTQLAWGPFYTDQVNGTSFDYNGMISWKIADPSYDQTVELTLYKNGTKLYTTSWDYCAEGADSRVYCTDWDFSLGELEHSGSGTYYYTVQAKGDGVSTADSTIATSPVWEYTMPEARLAAPTLKGWNGTVAAWDKVEGKDVGGYVVDVYYSATEANATSTEDLQRVHGFVQYNREALGEMLDYDIVWDDYARHKGYYYYTVTTVSDDVTKVMHSAPSALSAAYYNAEGTEPSATVTYVTNGGSAVESETINLMEKQHYTKPADPTRSGYTFAGWYWEPELRFLYDFDKVCPDPGEKTILYAKWTENRVEEEPAPDYGSDDSYSDNTPYNPTVDKETTKNEDGSTTVTETKKDGTTVETTTNTDASSVTTETKTEVKETASATTTTTTTETVTKDANGNKETVKVTEEVIERADGTIATTTTTETKLDNGSKGTTTVDETGKIEAEVKLTGSAINNAAKADEPVALPMPQIPASSNAETAPTVEIDIPNGKDSVAVEIPVENATAGTVAVIVHADGTEEIVMATTQSENGVVIPVSGDVTVKIVDNSQNFGDVDSDDWYSDAADFVSARGIMNGTDEESFAPATEASRAMVAVILHSLENNPDHAFDGNFSDVEDHHWYADGVMWAAENGIMSGTGDGGFSANDAVTREQLAVTLYSYANMKGIDTDTGASLNGFADGANTSDWAKQAMEWAVHAGLLSGKDGGMLDPTGTASRAEIAQILMVFCSKVMC